LSATSSESRGQSRESSQGASSVKSKPALKLAHVVGSKYIDSGSDRTAFGKGVARAG
jgi:hypothetical protein